MQKPETTQRSMAQPLYRPVPTNPRLRLNEAESVIWQNSATAGDGYESEHGSESGWSKWKLRARRAGIFLDVIAKLLVVVSFVTLAVFSVLIYARVDNISRTLPVQAASYADAFGMLLAAKDPVDFAALGAGPETVERRRDALLGFDAALQLGSTAELQAGTEGPTAAQTWTWTDAEKLVLVTTADRLLSVVQTLNHAQQISQQAVDVTDDLHEVSRRLPKVELEKIPGVILQVAELVELVHDRSPAAASMLTEATQMMTTVDGMVELGATLLANFRDGTKGVNFRTVDEKTDP